MLTTNPTTNPAELTAPAMTAKELKQQIQYRGALHTAVMHNARTRVKEQLRAAGLKVNHYSAREITELAEEYVQHHREELIEAVRPWVRELVFKTKR
jgi:hypothetical protein